MELTTDDLLEAYRRMRTIREFEERADIEFQQGNIPGFIHLYAGQEATGVGVCMALDDRDYISSTHRGHGHCIARHCDVQAMMLEIFGKAGGLCKGKGGSMHIADFSKGMLGANAIVGANAPIITGAALSAKTLGTGGVAVSFMGDGGSNQGTVFEAMNMAVVLQLPALFVFENNGYGEGTSVEYAVGSKDIASRAAGFGMPAEKVDGFDFFTVYEATLKAVNRARQGGGPSAIEFVSTRYSGHFVGDAQLYRPKEELDSMRDQDPLRIFRDRAVADKQLTLEELNGLDSEVTAEIEEAVDHAMNAPVPSSDELLKDVYVSY